MLRRLTVEEARSLLSDSCVARLGCVAEGKPYVVPVSYLLDGDSVYIHSLPGRKVTALRANPHACLQVDEVLDEYHWRSVLVFGSYEEITDPAHRRSLLRQLFSRFPQLTPVEALHSDHEPNPESIVFRVRIEEITGVAEG